jgi:integrase
MVAVNAIKNKKQIEKMKKVLSINKRNYCLFVLGINTGLRISDLLNLKFCNVLEKNKIKSSIRIKEQKTKKTNNIQINTNAKEALNLLIKYYKEKNIYSDDLYLFHSREGENKPISRVHAWQILNKAAKKSRIKGQIGTHTLRKTFGYWAYKQGIDITLLQTIFKHSCPSITLNYIGITHDDINNVYMNLDI